MAQATTEKKGSTQETSQKLDDKELKAAQDAGKAALEHVNDAEIDTLLEEIDGVLETNAEEFVGAFIQRGGQ